jgi:GTPase Era involved in 16S rRNA processing
MLKILLPKIERKDTNMTEVFLRYNPYKVETKLWIEEEELSNSSKIAPFFQERLQMWVDQLPNYLCNEINDDSFKLVFHGTLFDYGDVRKVITDYNEDHQAEIILEHKMAEGSDDKLTELTELFEHMQQGPFDDLRNGVIRKNFDKALSSDFEIAVIATMSSGKSTLINSLIGQELMPAKNKATTATIASIRNTDRDDFIGRCVDAEGSEIIPSQHLDSNVMGELNDNEKVSLIEIQGRIPSISAKNMNLILVDTPGPNNARNSSHHDHTFNVIKSEAKPMVLYIINATQFGINDDHMLLSSLADQMKSRGKQSKDRFIFAVNKIDELDPENESINETLQEVKEYLENNGILNPNIYPVSAEMAKLIRMNQNNHSMTKKQKGTLKDHEYFNEEESMHLINYAPLSRTHKDNLNLLANEAHEDGDTYEEALYHSGVPSIETAINVYLEKYAVTSKITSAVNAFKGVVVGKKLEQKLQEEMALNEDKRIQINNQMKKVKEEIERGNKAKILKNRINNRNYDHKEVIRRIEGKIEQKMDLMTEHFRNEERVSPSKAKTIINQLDKDITILQSDIKTDLELLIIATLKRDAVEMLNEYRSYVQDMIEVSGDALNLGDLKIFDIELPDPDDMVSRMQYTDDVEDGQTWVKTSTWWKPFSWGNGYYKTTYREEQFVDVNDITEEVIRPAKSNLRENTKMAKLHLKESENNLKFYFNSEINKLEKVLLGKVSEIEMLSRDSQALEVKLHEEKEKVNWIEDFLVRLDRILEI